jgi:hypothetical protein
LPVMRNPLSMTKEPILFQFAHPPFLHLPP